jgi:hypothetical protein
LSPIDGKVVRKASPGTNGLSGVVIDGGRYSAKVFYVDVDEKLIGKYVKVGDRIGTAQEIRKAYEAPNMTNHIHLEVYDRGSRINPLTLVGSKRSN